MKGSGVYQWFIALTQLQVQRRQQTGVNSVEESGREIMHDTLSATAYGPQYSCSTVNPALHHEMEGWVNMMCLSLILNSLLYSAWTLHSERTQGNTVSALNTCFNRWLPDACKNALSVSFREQCQLCYSIWYIRNNFYTEISLFNVVSL